MVEAGDLRGWISDARARTLALVSDLADDQLLGPRLPIVNPLLWEIAHVAWFQDLWVSRHALGRPPARAAGDSLYDSSAIPHDTRWDLPLLPRHDVIAYLEETAARAAAALVDDGPPALEYFARLAVFHEDMHDEAFVYTRQTLGTAPPPLPFAPTIEAGPCPGDVEVPGGPFLLGAKPATGFVFDNEKWAHEVTLEPFAIARAPVTQAELAAFVDEGGYTRRELWSDAGWAWRDRAGAEHPLHWRRGERGWERRDFDAWVPLEPHRPAIHVGWHEAQAYCAWAGRRLPTEAEWERAAEGAPMAGNLDAARRGCVDVGAFPENDSAWGCRQMMGNVWEWTASDFLPYPGFLADPYRDYSQPWFATHKVLRGGAWTTRARLLRPTWRNFYMPDRRDVLAGFPDLRCMNVYILTPAPRGSLHGNRITALRWAKRLRELGCSVKIGDSIADPHAIDLLIAVHARKTAGSVLFAHRARHDLPIVVCLAGTDVYGDLARPGPAAEQAFAALAGATRVLALQPLAEQALPEVLRAKVRTILQSACPVPDAPPPPEDHFAVTVIGHLRHVKDPLRVARATRLLPDSSRIVVTHVGASLSPGEAAAARAEERDNRRYRWLGQRPRRETLERLASSHLFVLPSEAEGGANVISEALAAQVGILCTAIPGSLGILGADHPGHFPVGDTEALAALLGRAETDAAFLEELRARSRALAPLVEPARERAAWAALLQELS